MGTVNEPSGIVGGFRPGTEAGQRAFVLTPFTRMARTHAISAMADAMVAASLAGSLFFAAPGGEARMPVFRYLLITMLPFALLSPLIGPLIDRVKGGHRMMVIASNVGRGIACWFMASSVDSGDFLFFLYALCLLVFQKAYAVARSALVPTLVRNSQELVQANSKLALVSGVASVVGVVPASAIIAVLGASWSLYLAMIVYFVGATMAMKISALRVAEEKADTTEKIELRGATIVMAGSAMALIRATAGFFVFLVAFSLSDEGKPTLAMALVGGSLAVLQQAGNLIAPRLRKLTSEENLLTGALGLVVGCGLASLVLGDIVGGMLLGGSVGLAASTGKLAFDSILQRDAPDANRGRAFARFETKFQTTWVIGAALPVGIHMTAVAGYAVVLVTAAFAVAAYALARMSYAHRTGAKQTIATARAAALDARLGEVSTEVKGRLAAMSRGAFRKLRSTGSGGSGRDDWDDYADEEWDDDPDGEWEEDWDEDWEEDLTLSEAEEWEDGRQSADWGYDEQPAASSPVAWNPDEDGEWRAPADERAGRDYLDDLDPSVDNPFPWSPDEPTRPS